MQLGDSNPSVRRRVKTQLLANLEESIPAAISPLTLHSGVCEQDRIGVDHLRNVLREEAGVTEPSRTNHGALRWRGLATTVSPAPLRVGFGMFVLVL